MTYEHGVTPEQRLQMIGWMAARFADRSDMSVDEAMSYAATVFDGYSDADLKDHEFGEEAARELADTDMIYWEG